MARECCVLRDKMRKREVSRPYGTSDSICTTASNIIQRGWCIHRGWECRKSLIACVIVNTKNQSRPEETWKMGQSYAICISMQRMFNWITDQCASCDCTPTYIKCLHGINFGNSQLDFSFSPHTSYTEQLQCLRQRIFSLDAVLLRPVWRPERSPN